MEYDEDGFQVYYKCNGAIKVSVAEDGTEFYDIPKDFTWVGTEDEDSVCCPYCDEDIFYHNGEYVCIYCESTFTEQELIDGHGDIFHG